MYANKASLCSSIGVVKSALSPLITPNQLCSDSPALPGGLLLIFCQKEKHTIIMLPFEIPSLSFGHRNKMHLIEMYVKRWGDMISGKPCLF